MMPEDSHGEEIGAPEHPGKRRTQGHLGDPSGCMVGRLVGSLCSTDLGFPSSSSGGTTVDADGFATPGRAS
jgi:hypothetical protein